MPTSCRTLFGNDDRVQLRPYHDYAQSAYARIGGGLLYGYQAALLLRVVEEAVKVSPIVVEIGTHRGHTAQMVGAFLDNRKLPGVLVSIDPVLQVPLHVLEDNLRTGRNLFIKGTSVEVAASWTACVGAVFVDGCHCRECVHADIKAWARLVAPGGYMLFHDATKDGRDQGKTLHGSPSPPAEVGAALAENDIIRTSFLRVGSAHRGDLVVYEKQWPK